MTKRELGFVEVNGDNVDEYEVGFLREISLRPS
jgi:hypothetical protein